MPRFRMFLPDGSDLDDFVTSAWRWLPGDEVTVTPRERYRIRAVVTPDALDDFDDDYAGIWEVEPITT
jgi:hypothetical protein